MRPVGLAIAASLALVAFCIGPAAAQFVFDPSKPARPPLALEAPPAPPPSPGVSTTPFSADDLLKGTRVSREACTRLPDRVFVEAMGEGLCIAYYLAGPTRGRVASVYMPGDSLGPGGAPGKFRVLPGYAEQSPALLMQAGAVWAERLGTPMIFLGRLGMHGSSGWHAHRHSLKEVEAANRALDQIRARHGLAGFHLVGQSGGGLIVAGLLSRRADIGCAVMASAPLDLRAFYKATRILYRVDGEIQNFDPPAEAARVARNARIFVVTDPQDQSVPAPTQTAYAAALARAGIAATQILTPARDARRHALVEKSFFIARDCIAGRPPASIKARFEALGPTQFGD